MLPFGLRTSFPSIIRSRDVKNSSLYFIAKPTPIYYSSFYFSCLKKSGFSTVPFKRHSPEVVFLSETHLDVWPPECLRRSLRMDFKEVVRTDGRSGGLLLLWKKEVLVTLRHKSKNYIDVCVGNSQEDVWRFTGFYE